MYRHSIRSIGNEHQIAWYRTTFESLAVGVISPERALSQMDDVQARDVLSDAEFQRWEQMACPSHYVGTETILSSITHGATGSTGFELLRDNDGSCRIVTYGHVPDCAEIDPRGRIVGRVYDASALNKQGRRTEGMHAMRSVTLSDDEASLLIAEIERLDIARWQGMLDAQGDLHGGYHAIGQTIDYQADGVFPQDRRIAWQVFYRDVYGNACRATALRGQDIARHAELVHIVRASEHQDFAIPA